MVFLVTIVLQCFAGSQRIVASRIDSSYNFSIIIEAGTKRMELLAEFNEKLNQFIKDKTEFVESSMGSKFYTVLASVSTVKL